MCLAEGEGDDEEDDGESWEELDKKAMAGARLRRAVFMASEPLIVLCHGS